MTISNVDLNVTKGYVGGPGRQVHFRSTEGSKGTIVLLHQTASSSRMYLPLMPYLSGEYRLIAVDTPGFGESCPLTETPTIQGIMRRIRSAIHDLGVDAGYHIVGHHTGAVLACEWGKSYPDEVSTVTAIGALAMGKEKRKVRAANIPTTYLSSDGSHLQVAWERVVWMDRTSRVDDVLWHREVVDTLMATPSWPATYRAVFDYDFDGSWSKLTQSSQTICGVDDVEVSNLPRVRMLRPDFPVHELPGGTFVVEEQPQRVAGLIRKLIEDHMQSKND